MASAHGFVYYSLQGLAISEELGDKTGEGVVNGNLGMAYEILNSLEEAQEHYKKVCSVK